MVKRLKNNIPKSMVPLYVLLAIVVVAILFFAFQKKDRSAENNLRSIIKLSESVREFYKNRRDYWGLNTESVLEQKISAPIENSYDKKILIGQGFDGRLSMPGAMSFDVVYKDLNRLQCIRILTAKLNESETLGLIKVAVRSGETETDFSWSGENKLPVSLNTAKQHCGESNDIMWTFE